MKAIDTIKQNFTEARDLLDQFMANEKNFEALEKAGKILVNSVKSEHKIISCGNGGSMSDAMHFAEELTGRFRDNRQPIPAVAIADPTHLSCTANDYGYEHVFSRYVEAFGKEGDVLLAISTSGNSENIIKAVKAAKERNMKIITLTGKDGGKMANMGDVELRAPKSQYADRAQEIHIKIIHSLIHFMELEL